MRWPNYPDAYLVRGSMLCARGERDAAVADYTKAIELRPRFAEAYCGRGEVYLTQGKFDEALRDFNEAIAANELFARAYHCRGVLRHQMGDPAAALADHGRAIELVPNDPSYYLARASASLWVAHYAQAAADYSEAIRQNPALVEAFAGRAQARYQMGRFEPALEDCETALRLNPDDVAAWNCRAWSLYSLGQLSEAAWSFARVVAAGAADNNAKAAFAWVLATCPVEGLHDSTNAQKALDIALEIQSAFNLPAKDRQRVLAAAYANAGRYEEALRTQQAAIDCAKEEQLPELRQALECYAVHKPYRSGKSGEKDCHVEIGR